MVDVTRPGAADIVELAERMRRQDLDEIRASGCPDPQIAVYDSVRLSALCWAMRIDGELACIVGVAPVSALVGVGSPWLLGTELVARRARILSRHVPRYVAQMLATFPHLVNHVHAANTVSVRWLARAGFALAPAAPRAPLGEMFHQFTMRA